MSDGHGAHLLFVESDDPTVTEDVRRLARYGYAINRCNSLTDIPAHIYEKPVDAVLADYAAIDGSDGLQAAVSAAERISAPLIVLLPPEADTAETSAYIHRADPPICVATKGGPEAALISAVESAQRRHEAVTRATVAEREYRRLLSNVRDAVLVANTERRIVDCNEAFTELFGYSCDELLGHKTRVIYRDDREFESLGRSLSASAETPRFIHTAFYRTRSGRIFPGETNVYSQRDAHGRITRFVGVIRDVSRRHAAERGAEHLTQVLRASRKVSHIINHAEEETTLLQGVCDTLVGTRGYAYAWVALEGREGAGAFAGAGVWESIEALRERISAGGLPTCARRARSAGEIHVTREPPSECEACPLREPAQRDGLSALTAPLIHGEQQFGTITASLPREMAEDSEEIELFAELAQDLSVGIFSLRARRRVADSEHRFRLLAENLPGVVYLCKNDRQWTMLYMNDSGARLTGYEPREFYDGTVNLARLVHPEERDRVYTDVQEAVKRHEPFHLLYRLTCRDGSTRWIEEFGDAVRDEHGSAAYLEGFLTDVTERVEHERRIARLLEEKDLLLREVYHRVKNNMLTVASLLSLQAGHAASECADALEEARGRVVGMVELYEQLHRSSDVAVVDLGTYLARAAEELVAAHRRSSDVVLEPSFEHIEVDTQTGFRLGLVFTELLTNALKYAFEPGAGGTISVAFQRSADGDAVLTVEDDGLGVRDAEEGFGLTLVHELVEQMGGRFHLESDTQGTRATVVIPLRSDRPG